MNLSTCYLRVSECSTTNEFYEVLIISETEEWIRFASYVTEVVFIVLVNAFTLGTFATNHQLRKRSTYLIINMNCGWFTIWNNRRPVIHIGNSYPREVPATFYRRVVQLARTYVTDFVFPISGSLLSQNFIDFLRKVTRYKISFQALPHWRKGLL